MYRFHGAESANIAVNGLTPRDFYDLLSGIWCAETCAPRMRAEWTPDNPTLGQCSITAFLMQDIFGGQVFGVPLGDGNYHCFNVVEGCAFDLTSEQFGARILDYDAVVEQFREVHFAKEEKRLRYEALRTRLMREYAVRLKHGGCNCCQALLCAYARAVGQPEALMKRVGAAFGGGMGGMEGTCGALVAAGVLLGLVKYRDASISRDARALQQAFAERCGATVCRVLKGVGTGVALCGCDDCVRNASDIFLEMKG